jgi:hypothetical protein
MGEGMVKLRCYTVVLLAPFILCLVGGAASIALIAMTEQPQLAMLPMGIALGGGIVAALFSFAIVCPSCGKSPCERKHSHLVWGMPLADRTCWNSGHSCVESNDRAT